MFFSWTNFWCFQTFLSWQRRGSLLHWSQISYKINKFKNKLVFTVAFDDVYFFSHPPEPQVTSFLFPPEQTMHAAQEEEA